MNWRSVAIWVLLVVVFVALYNFFSIPHGDDGAVGVASRFGPSFWIFVAVVFVLVLVFVLRRNQKAYGINNEGITLLGQGRYIDALAKFQKAEPLMKKQPLIHYNLGVVMMWLWQLHEAEAELLKAKKKPPVGVDLKNLVVPQLALLYAIQGKLAEAEREISEAAKMNLVSHASVLLAQGLLSLRRADPRAAVEHLGRQEVKQLGGVGRALADAAYTWAIQQATGEARHVDRVTLFGEVGPDRLRSFWPELVAYAETARQA